MDLEQPEAVEPPFEPVAESAGAPEPQGAPERRPLDQDLAAPDPVPLRTPACHRTRHPDQRRAHGPVLSTKAGPKPPPKAETKKPEPPGLIEQLQTTAKAASTLALAHVDLAKEEASAIGREGGRLAGLVAAAVGLVVIAAILAIIGTSLFLGEWLLGSLSWGVLHGVLLFVTGAVALVLLALRVAPSRSSGPWSSPWSSAS